MITSILTAIFSGISFLLTGLQDLLNYTALASLLAVDSVYEQFSAAGSPFYTALVFVNSFVDLNTVILILSLTIVFWWSGSFIIRRMRKISNN